MAQYRSYSSSSNEPATVTRCPIDCLIPEFCPEASPPTHNQNTAAMPFTIDYSYFINEMSSKRQPSQLREISSYIYYTINAVVLNLFRTTEHL